MAEEYVDIDIRKCNWIVGRGLRPLNFILSVQQELIRLTKDPKQPKNASNVISHLVWANRRDISFAIGGLP